MNLHANPPRIPRIAFVMGDPAGISAELAAKLLADKSNHAQASVLVIGDRRVLAEGERIAGVHAGLTYVPKPQL